MREMTYMDGEVSRYQNTFTPGSRTADAKPQIIAEVMPEIKEEKIIAEPVIQELEEAPTLVEDAVAPKKATKKKKAEDNTENLVE